jgi:imidazolonepropionase-like amidohydrolase
VLPALEWRMRSFWIQVPLTGFLTSVVGANLLSPEARIAAQSFEISLGRFTMRLLALALVLAAVPTMAQGPPADLAVRHVTIIDVRNGKTQTNQRVIVQNGRIVAIEPDSPKAPRAAKVVDAGGKFLIPGLWDMHVHIEFAPKIFTRLYLAQGITGIRDMRMELDALLKLRAEIASGEIFAPRLVASGPALDDLPPQFPLPVKLRVKTADDGRKAVIMLKANRVDFIKVHNFTSREAFFAIMDEAKRQNLTVVGHVPLKVSIQEATEAGMKSIEHLSEFRIVDECSDAAKCQSLIALFKKYDTWQTPTLVELRSEAQETPVDERRAQYVPAKVKEVFWKLTEGMLQNMTDAQKGYVKGDYKRAGPLVAEFQRQGIGILAGTDSPAFPNVVSGFSLHDELALMVEGGLTPLEALRTATLNPARFLGKLDDLGTIEKGKLADLVILDANPLEDIHNTTKINAVVAQGKLLDRSDLDRLMREAEEMAKALESTAQTGK